MGDMLAYEALQLKNLLAEEKVIKEKYIKYYGNNHPIIVYPEAHVWPYYTKIRPFKTSAFTFPVEEEKEVYCATTTYQKSKLFKKPKVVMLMVLL